MAKGSFSNEQVDAICAVEQVFWQTGSLATNEKISELTGINVKTIEKYWTDEDFRNALMHRGVDLNTERSQALLTMQQLNLANMLLNMSDPRSLREKLNECGVTTQQYNAWLRTEAFKDYLALRGKQIYESNDHEAYMALVGAVKNGDTKALQLFFEMRGIYNPRQTVEIQNISVILVRIIEIVSMHVRDPQVLEAIASDLERIELSPGQPLQLPVVSRPMSQIESTELVI